MKMNIRYVGWLHSDNLGDAALYSVIQGLFKPAVVSATLSEYDAVVIGGGTLILRSGCLKQAKAATESSKETCVFGSGVADPEFRDTSKHAVWRAVLDRCFYIGVRGFRSQQILQELGCHQPVEVIGDPALLVGSRFTKPTEHSNGHHHLVINICNPERSRLWGGDNEAVRATVVSSVNHLLELGRSITFVSFDPRNDSYIRSAIEDLGRQERVDFVKGYESLDRTLNLFARASLVIGEKLHSTIFSAAVGTPFISLGYQPKCLDFATTLGLEQFVLRTDRLTDSGLIDKVHEVEDHNRQLRERLHVRVAYYRKKLREAAFKVKAHLQSAGVVSGESKADIRDAPVIPRRSNDGMGKSSD